VLHAGEADSPTARAALERLCGAYWFPLYAHVRRRGHGPDDAADLTQGFFAVLLHRNSLAQVGPEKGRFRTFLLTSLDYFLSDQTAREHAAKRGGGQALIELDGLNAEQRFALEPATDETPDKAFDRRWAAALLEQAFARLEVEQTQAGKASLFTRLRPFLVHEAEPGDYDALSADWTSFPTPSPKPSSASDYARASYYWKRPHRLSPPSRMRSGNCASCWGEILCHSARRLPMNNTAIMTTPLCPRCRSPMTGSVSSPYCARCAGRMLLDSAAAEDGHEDAVPKQFAVRLGEYELGPELGRGAMGVVYRARQPRLRREVAVKIILAGRFVGESARKRFQAEAELAAQLDHPNIVPIYEVGEAPEGPYYAMKLVEGGTLAERMTNDECRMTNENNRARIDFVIRHSTFVISKVARAIHHAHQRGVLHRDLKPGNILIDKEGEPYVTDFGLAKLLRNEIELPTLDPHLTLSGTTLGTPAYMAPEQAAGQPGITIAADVWSLGAMLFHLLAGRPPFTGASVADILLQSSTQEVPSLRGLNPSVSADLETICLKCLEKDPMRRYASAAGLADDLEHWQRGEPIEARRSSAGERVFKWARRHPALAAMGGALLAAVVFGVAGITWQWDRANRNAQTAQSALRESQEALWQANFDRAHALRTSRQMGQRVEALKAIRAAAIIHPTLELRNEAIAAMALTDLEDVGVWYPRAKDGSLGVLDPRLELIADRRKDGLVAIGRVQDRRILATLPIPPRAGFGFSASSDLLAANNGSRFQVWDWRRTNLLTECPSRPNNDCSALSPDGRWLAYNETNSAVIIREVRTGREVVRIETLANRAVGLCFSADGELFGMCVDGIGLEVWRVTDGRRVGKTTELAINTLCMDFLPGQTLLATGAGDPSVYAWDFASGKVQKIGSHRREGAFPSWHPGGNLLASVAWDQVLRFWDPFAGVQLFETTIGRGGFSADGQWMTVENARGVGRLKVRIPTECRLFHRPLGMDQNFAVAFSPDDHFLAGTCNDDLDQGLGIWEVASGKRVEHVRLPWMGSAEFISDRLIAAATGGEVMLVTNTYPVGWTLLPQALIATQSNSGLSWGISFNADRTQLVGVRGSAGEVYDFPSGRFRVNLVGQRLIARAVFSRDGRWLASGYWDNAGAHRSEFRIWSAEDGQTARTIPMGNCNPVFSPDGRWLLVASEKEYLQFAIIGHPTNWTVVRQFPLDTGGFDTGSAAFSADGKLLAVQADQRIFRLLETATGRELARLTPLPDAYQTRGGVFSHNGRWFAAATDIGLHVWDLALIRARLREMNLDWDGPPETVPGER
jgi:serine/threonine protein kinase/WD40 repeat protein/DNA-directed RNA polymerase specialized sigma24 family protein